MHGVSVVTSATWPSPLIGLGLLTIAVRQRNPYLAVTAGVFAVVGVLEGCSSSRTASTTSTSGSGHTRTRGLRSAARGGPARGRARRTAPGAEREVIETTADVSSSTGAHPSTLLNEVVHQRARLGILALLAESGRADFPYIRTALQLTDGNLGRHLEVLAREGLVTITKGYEGSRPRTWAEVTDVGESALAAEVAAMKTIVERLEKPRDRRRRSARPD